MKAQTAAVEAQTAAVEASNAAVEAQNGARREGLKKVIADSHNFDTGMEQEHDPHQCCGSMVFLCGSGSEDP